MFVLFKHYLANIEIFSIKTFCFSFQKSHETMILEIKVKNKRVLEYQYTTTIVACVTAVRWV